MEVAVSRWVWSGFVSVVSGLLVGVFVVDSMVAFAAFALLV